MKLFGYVRVSSRDQNEQRQLDALTAYGVAARDIIVDKQSGKDFDRPGWTRLLRRLRPGDTLAVKSIDRLGRNYDEILLEWRCLIKELGVDIVVLDMPLLDTRRGRDLTGTLISDIVLQLLSYVAQTERENIRQRQREGIAAAKARGIRFGRPAQPIPAWFPELYRAWKEEGLTANQDAARGGLSSRYAFQRLRLKYEHTLTPTLCRCGDPSLPP